MKGTAVAPNGNRWEIEENEAGRLLLVPLVKGKPIRGCSEFIEPDGLEVLESFGYRIELVEKGREEE